MLSRKHSPTGVTCNCALCLAFTLGRRANETGGTSRSVSIALDGHADTGKVQTPSRSKHAVANYDSGSVCRTTGVEIDGFGLHCTVSGLQVTLTHLFVRANNDRMDAPTDLSSFSYALDPSLI